MIKRKTRFAAPFVFIAASAAAGCGGGQKAEPPHENPPGPERRSVDACAQLVGGDACNPEHDGACAVPNDTSCGLIGWDCIDEGGKSMWTAQMALCNPPPPAEEVPLTPINDNPPPPR